MAYEPRSAEFFQELLAVPVSVEMVVAKDDIERFRFDLAYVVRDSFNRNHARDSEVRQLYSRGVPRRSRIVEHESGFF